MSNAGSIDIPATPPCNVSKYEGVDVMSSFENLRMVDNFYQTSLFFPMPTVIINDKRAKEKGKK